MSFPVLTGSEGANWEMTLSGDSQSAINISDHKVRLHVIIRFRAQGNGKRDLHSLPCMAWAAVKISLK